MRVFQRSSDQIQIVEKREQFFGKIKRKNRYREVVKSQEKKIEYEEESVNT